MFPPMSTTDPHALRSALLAFFDERRRDLPWRRTTDPYRIWVSEVMLQQTRVETVIPYYERWLERFPTLEALADADEAEVLKAWEGLGYYSRARNLHRAAAVVRERHAGRVPEDADALRALPGVGDYTAGAVGSIAFGRAEPAVDGNVRRVLSRLFDLDDPAPAGLRRLAKSLVPDERPGDFNQALMELGATVCVPKGPACGVCPVADLCLARVHGTVGERPAPRKARALPEDEVATAVLVAPTGRLLLVRRPGRGLLGGMWEMPGVPLSAGESAATAVVRLRADLGLAATDGDDEGRPMPPVVHTFSHRRTTYRPVRLGVAEEAEPRLPPRREAPSGSSAAGVWTEWAWAGTEEVEGLALPVAQRVMVATR